VRGELSTLTLDLAGEFVYARSQADIGSQCRSRAHERADDQHADFYGPLHFRPTAPPNTLRLGNFESAKNSGLLQFLSPEEVATATDGEVSFGRVADYQETVRAATRKRAILEQRFKSEDQPDSFNLSSITSLQLDDYLERLLDERAAISEYLAYLEICHRGAVAILSRREDTIYRHLLLEREGSKPPVATQ
jgi:hypothetical protein